MRSEVVDEFLVFARHLNFSKAAAELHITQPSLSKHMKELEREVGVELIDRKTYGKNRPVLSRAGRYFFEEMSYLSTGLQSTLDRCRSLGRADVLDVRIQELWQNNAMILLYKLAGAFQSEHPERALRYVRLTDRQPIDALLENEFDMVFDVWCGPYGERVKQLADLGVKTLPLMTEPLCIWVQDGNRYVGDRETVGLEELLDIPVIMTRGGSLDYMVASYADCCERAGLVPRLRRLQPADNSPTGMFMADFHDGALMTTPAMVHDPRLRSRTDLRYVQVNDERVDATFLLAVRASDKGACAFLDYVRAHKDE